MSECLSESALHAYHAEELSPAQLEAARRHLESCPDCARRGAALVAEQDQLLLQARELKLQAPLPTVEAAGPKSSVRRVSAGAEIGPYKLLEVLGEGGLGTVYLAQQDQPVRRRVALKVIKAGMDTREVVRRFEAERQALAVMDHPFVAKVFDGGATPEGRPYFVMEYVAGEPITVYCDRNKLGMPERLELFIGVCEAVQHAHQKGIIHRDIKPSNVLVSASAVGQSSALQCSPKVIDFGVAKATNQRLTEQTLYTEQGLLIGTPEYMSPEQAEMGATDVDTRTDIYSLGVLLYEILTGSLPFDAYSLRRAGYAEIQRIIREVDPPRPSTKLSALRSEPHPNRAPTVREGSPNVAAGVLAGRGSGAVVDLAIEPAVDSSTVKAERPGSGPTKATSAAEVAARRRTDAKTLLRQLRGDLDWIVMKCIEKDRTRRYETANALAMEVKRFLNNEPVLAGPPSVAYRMRKFVRRNRGGVIAGCVIAATLIAATVGMSLVSAWAIREKERAVLAEQQQSRERERAEAALAAEAEQRARAEVEAEKAKAVRRFLEKDLLSSVSPSSGLGAKVTVREVLDKALDHVDRAFQSQPELQVSLKSTVGSMYRALGLFEQAQQVLEPTFEFAKRTLGDEHLETLRALRHLIEAHMFQAQFGTIVDDSLRLVESLRQILGPDHLDTLDAMDIHAIALMITQHFDEAEALFKQVLEVRVRIQGPDHADVHGARANLGSVYHMSGRRREEAIRLLRDATNGYTRLYGPDHPEALGSSGGVGSALLLNGQIEEAREILTQAADGYARVYGREHGARAALLSHIGACLIHENQYEKAKGFIDEAYDLSSKTYGKNHVTTIAIRLAQIRLLAKSGKPKKAEKLVRRMIDSPRPMIRENSVSYWQALHLLADIHIQTGKYETAVEEDRRVLELMQKFPAHGQRQADVKVSCGSALAALNRFDEAEEMFLSALSEYREKTAEDGHFVQSTLVKIVELYKKWGKPEKARNYAAMITSSQPAATSRSAETTSAPASAPSR